MDKQFLPLHLTYLIAGMSYLYRQCEHETELDEIFECEEGVMCGIYDVSERAAVELLKLVDLEAYSPRFTYAHLTVGLVGEEDGLVNTLFYRVLYAGPEPVTTVEAVVADYLHRKALPLLSDAK